jgi:hypothetical protein
MTQRNINYGITNTGSGSITSHGDMVAGAGNTVTPAESAARADLLRTVEELRELLRLGTGAAEEVDAELRKDEPDKSRLVAGIDRLKATAQSLGGLLAEVAKFSDTVDNVVS